MRMQLHLQRLQFAGGECLLIFILFGFFSANAFQILVSVSADNIGDLYKRIIREAAPNHFTK
jgi:hypothetical protein